MSTEREGLLTLRVSTTLDDDTLMAEFDSQDIGGYFTEVVENDLQRSHLRRRSSEEVTASGH